MSDKKPGDPMETEWTPAQEARVIAAQARIDAASDAREAANIELEAASMELAYALLNEPNPDGPGGSRGS